MNAQKTSKQSSNKTKPVTGTTVAAISQQKKQHKSVPSETTPAPETGLAEPQLAIVQDLTGFAVLAMPPELRKLIGHGTLVSDAQDLESQELLLIVRQAGLVAYVHLPFVVKEMEASALPLRPGRGVVLKDVTGSPPQTNAGKREPEVKARAARKAANRTPKGGRHV